MVSFVLWSFNEWRFDRWTGNSILCFVILGVHILLLFFSFFFSVTLAGNGHAGYQFWFARETFGAYILSGPG